jgi:hypothetical protein
VDLLEQQGLMSQYGYGLQDLIVFLKNKFTHNAFTQIGKNRFYGLVKGIKKCNQS